MEQVVRKPGDGNWRRTETGERNLAKILKKKALKFQGFSFFNEPEMTK